ncbi:predicted protein [Clavispora lusitaniae ATCC 42720]|uniref:Uncharacterized protein n=1 Tax=Clavispora lusitaniae (strain ATCC 42720) TaxID=306902 RepID=C4Y1V7_CLAL4|nr:uncharacterized protein CLUG_02189 [Clavispora lusitaniae ATCC 42720]EEQ38067.1 predicted protein [Clavispora lusitaniae ATCC 42720]
MHNPTIRAIDVAIQIRAQMRILISCPFKLSRSTKISSSLTISLTFPSTLAMAENASESFLLMNTPKSVGRQPKVSRNAFLSASATDVFSSRTRRTNFEEGMNLHILNSTSSGIIGPLENRGYFGASWIFSSSKSPSSDSLGDIKEKSKIRNLSI